MRACERRAGYGRLVCPACAQHTCCVQRSGRLAPAGAGLVRATRSGWALPTSAAALGRRRRSRPMARVRAPCAWQPRANPTSGRTRSRRPPSDWDATTRPAARLSACRAHSRRLRPAAAAAARRVHPAWRDCPMQRMRSVAAPGQAQPRCTAKIAHVGRSEHPCGGAGWRWQRVAWVRGGPARSVAVRRGAVAQSPAGRPPTCQASSDTTCPAAKRRAHRLRSNFGRTPGWAPPSKDGWRDVNSTDPPRRPGFAVAPIRGTTPRPPAARRPATRLRRFLRNTRPVTGPRRPPPTGHTATVPQQCGTATNRAMQKRF